MCVPYHFLDCLLFPLLQFLLKSAGVKGQKTVFLLTDSQIKEEAFLEDVDSVLNTGEVPNLFATDEKAEIMEVGFHRPVRWIIGFGLLELGYGWGWSCWGYCPFFFISSHYLSRSIHSGCCE